MFLYPYQTNDDNETNDDVTIKSRCFIMTIFTLCNQFEFNFQHMSSDDVTSYMLNKRFKDENVSVQGTI